MQIPRDMWFLSTELDIACMYAFCGGQVSVVSCVVFVCPGAICKSFLSIEFDRLFIFFIITFYRHFLEADASCLDHFEILHGDSDMCCIFENFVNGASFVCDNFSILVKQCWMPLRMHSNVDLAFVDIFSIYGVHTTHTSLLLSPFYLFRAFSCVRILFPSSVRSLCVDIQFMANMHFTHTHTHP